MCYATGSGCHCSGWFIFSFPAALLSLSPWTVTAPFFPVLTYSGQDRQDGKCKEPPPPVPGGPLTEHSDGGRAPVTQAFSLQVMCLSIGGNLSLCLTQLRAAMQKSLPGYSSTQLRPPSENCRNEGEEVGRQGYGQKELLVWGGRLSWGTQCPSSPHSQVCLTAEIKVNDEGHSP